MQTWPLEMLENKLYYLCFLDWIQHHKDKNNFSIPSLQEGDPCKVGVAVTDITSGLYACSSILAALISRGRTGKGQHIDVNLLSSQV